MMNEITENRLRKEFGETSRGIAVEILPDGKSNDLDPVIVFQEVSDDLSFAEFFTNMSISGMGSNFWIKGVADNGTYYTEQNACNVVLGGNKCQI